MGWSCSRILSAGIDSAVLLTGGRCHIETPRNRMDIYLSKMLSCLSMFSRSFPNNYWDKFVKRKVRFIFQKIYEAKIKF